jgi:phenylacetic acid degradation operon negative regulatory protein
MIKLGATEKLIVYLLLHHKKWMATKKILELLTKIHKTESAVRASLFRLRKKNIIKALGKGRETFFMWSEFAQEIITSYLQRVTLSENKWNGKWLIFSFNIPERKRKLRTALKDELILRGFGRLHTNLWISPYDLREKCNQFIKRFGLKKFTVMFMADCISGDNYKLACRIWDLNKLSKTYQKLKLKYKNDLDNFKKLKFHDQDHISLEALVRLAKITDEMLEFSTTDPYLPKEILPGNWAGAGLNDVFSKYEGLLHKKASSLIKLEDHREITSYRKG